MRIKFKILCAAAVAAAPFFLFAKDPFAGFYEGKILGAKSYPLEHSPEVYGRVVKDGDTYKFDLLSAVFARSESHCSASGLAAKDGKIELKNTAGANLKGEITPEGIKASGELNGNKVELSLRRMDVKSPTLGLEAPAGAVMLFDGKDMSQWVQAYDGSPCAWDLKDGAMVSKPLSVDGKRRDGTIRSKGKFGAFRMHLEFKIPPSGSGNSGVYVGPYEIQVFNSFGREGSWYDCGSIYRQHPPKVNASLEPEAWQTYDIEYRPAQFDGGRLISHPTFTVYHNGVRIHNAKFDGDTLVEFPRFTVYLNGVLVQKDTPAYSCTSIGPRNFAKFKHPRNGVQLNLQDHTNKVAYRNIWVQPL